MSDGCSSLASVEIRWDAFYPARPDDIAGKASADSTPGSPCPFKTEPSIESDLGQAGEIEFSIASATERAALPSQRKGKRQKWASLP